MLTSKLFAGDQLLEAIAAEGPDRISKTQNATTPAVRKIQLALLDWDPGALPESGADGQFGAETASAVHEFKATELDVAEAAIIDDVGPRTVTRLDEIRSDAERPVTRVLPVDVIVRFRGAHRRGPLTEPDILPDRLLAEYNRRGDRTLVRLGAATTTIRDESAAMISEFVQRIRAAQGDDPGQVFIYGSSSGGRNAVDLAAALTSAGASLRYVAATDAACFPDEALNSPDNFFGEPTVVPDFAVAPIVADEKLNFLQTVGNHSELTLTHGRMFTSTMAGKEVHGTLSGFTLVDMTQAVRDATPSSDDDAHVKLIIAATPVVQDRISALLTS